VSPKQEEIIQAAGKVSPGMKILDKGQFVVEGNKIDGLDQE